MAKSWKTALNSTSKQNPFELKFNKQKFDILNRSGSAVGRPGVSKKRAEEVRKTTLLKEFRSFGKTSKIVDRRFGRGLDETEASAARFAMTRTKRDRQAAKYNLENDSDHEVELTHKGKSLDDKNMNDFIDSGDEAFVDSAHDNFGNFTVSKTKAEIMKEVIAKSKFYKFERQKLKEENEAMCGDVDANFDVIKSGLLFSENKRKPKYEEADNLDDFDSAVCQLAFDKRLAAQNEQKKSPEDFERDALEKEFKKNMEKEKRMKGQDDSVDDEEQQLTRKMKLAEKDLADKVDSFCASLSTLEANQRYSVLIEEIERSTHQQVLLGRVIRDRLSRIYKNFTDKVYSGKPFVSKPGIVLLLLLVKSVFSTFDFHHVVSTPAQLCGLYVLDYGRMSRVRHVVFALWICEILLEYQSESKRYLPEVMNSLLSIYVAVSRERMATNLLIKRANSLRFGEKEFTADNLLSDADSISKEAILAKLKSVLKRAAGIYFDHTAFPEIFESFSSIDQGIQEMVQKKVSSRKPLLLHIHKPVPLPLLEPHIDEDLIAGRHRRPDNSQRRVQKLKSACKKESRSAQRELKKDSMFLARQKSVDVKTKDAEYKERMNKLYGSIGNEGSNKK